MQGNRTGTSFADPTYEGTCPSGPFLGHLPMTSPKRACVITYGCQMNEYESAVIERMLVERGFSLDANPEEADLILLNTCTVRARPEHKVFSQLGAFRRLKQRRPEVRLIVCGCVAQQWGAGLLSRAPHVDAVIGSRDLRALQRFLDGELGDTQVVAGCLESDPFVDTPPLVRQSQVTAFVTIVEGCSYFCRYCIVPYVRGKATSRPLGGVLREVQFLAEQGVREVTLLGQSVNSYGRDLRGGPRFLDVLQAVHQVPGIERIRFTSAHPRDFTEQLLEALPRLPKVCEHFHLPLQSGDDAVLKAMGRGYTADQYLDLVGRLRRAAPEVAITTDVMVGFPGESEQAYGNTLSLMAQVRFDQAFMFKYSDRPGTRAATMESKVPAPEKQRRLEQLVAQQNRIAAEINAALVGREMEVLVEGRDRTGNLLSGRTRTNKIFHLEGQATPGDLVQARAERTYLWGFRGPIAARP